MFRLHLGMSTLGRPSSSLGPGSLLQRGGTEAGEEEGEGGGGGDGERSLRSRHHAEGSEALSKACD